MSYLELGLYLAGAAVVLVLVGAAYLALRAKRKVGRVDIKFDSSLENMLFIIIVLIISFALWLLGVIFTDARLNLIIVAWTPYLFLVHNPSYLGENGLKAGLQFIPRDRLRSFEFVDDFYRLYTLIHLDGRAKPVKLAIANKQRDEERRKALDAYFLAGDR